MKRVFVTGATGFIGQHCLPLLRERGYQVHALSTRDVFRDAKKDGVTWHWANLHQDTTNAVLRHVRPTHLLHLAWYAEPQKYWTARENISWVATTAHLLRAFAEHGGRRVVGAGSCAEYNWRYGLCSETFTPCEPASLYGACKYTTHLMLDAWAKQVGISGAWGRIFFLYGPHEHASRLVRSVASSLLRGEPALCSQGIQRRDFLHVQDVAEAFVKLLDSSATGAVNIASGTPLAVSDIVWRIADLVGRRDLIKLGAIPGAEKEPSLVYADVGRLKQEVGFAPRFDLDSGLAQTIEWIKQGNL